MEYLTSDIPSCHTTGHLLLVSHAVDVYTDQLLGQPPPQSDRYPKSQWYSGEKGVDLLQSQQKLSSCVVLNQLLGLSELGLLRLI